MTADITDRTTLSLPVPVSVGWEHEGPVMLHHQSWRVEITDHGSGLGAPLLDRLKPPERRIGAPLRPDATRLLGRVDLHPVDERPGEVGLSLDGSAPQPLPTGQLDDEVLSWLTRRVLDERPAVAHLHAGAVVAPGDQTVVILGGSGAGKSTLVAHLGALGCAVLTDEQVALHPHSGRVAGFGRPIAVKPGGARWLPPEVALAEIPGCTQLLHLEALGAVHAPVGRPSLLALVERTPAHAEPAGGAIPIEPAEALESLCANNLDLARDPERVLPALAWLATTTRCVLLRYATTATAASLLTGLVEREIGRAAARAPEGAWWWLSGPAATGAAATGRSVTAPAVQLRPGVLAVGLAGGAVLYEPERRGLALVGEATRALLERLPLVALPEQLEDRDDLVVLAEQGFVQLG